MIESQSFFAQLAYRHPEARLPRVFEVAELGEYIGALLADDPVLQDVWLRGEVSNASRSPAGHHYFCLKDGAGQLKCVLFRGHAARSPVLPRSGLALVAHGSVRFYEAHGICELIVDLLFPEGVGLAQMQLEALFRRLEAEGLFDQERKRPLPAHPRRIGLITSDGGAVIHDIVTVLRRRYPLAEVIFLPTTVQGAAAPTAIAAALRALNEWTAPASGETLDVVLVARGGGSAEDLAAFNDERLVRAIFASRVPVVCAVGHETDVTLADLVADLRAPTPSAAAEMITPDVETLRRDLVVARSRAAQRIASQVALARAECQAARDSLENVLRYQLRAAREQVAHKRAQLSALSPQATLQRGYALAEVDGRVVHDAAELRPGDVLTVRLQQGRVDSTVTTVHPG